MQTQKGGGGVTGRNTKRNMLIGLLAFLPVLLLLYWRLPYGFGWNDEAVPLTTAWRFLQGDRPFLDSWDPHQSFAVLLMEPLRLYREAVGSLDGVLLLFRGLHLVFSLLLALWCGYCLYAFSHNLAPALFSALLIWIMAPSALGTMTAQSTALLLMTAAGCSVLPLYRPMPGRRTVTFALPGGLLGGGAVVCYPLFLLAVPCFFVMIGFCIPHRKNHRRLKALIPFAAGVVLFPVLFLVRLTGWIGLPGVTENLCWLFTTRSTPVSGWGQAVFPFVQNYVKADPFHLMPLSLFLLWALFRYLPIPLQFRPVKWFNRIIKITLPVCVFTSLVITLITGDGDLTDPMKLNRMMLCVGFWPLLLFLRHRRQKQFGALFWCLYMPAQCMALACWWCDRENSFSAAAMLLPAMVCLVMMCWRLYMMHGKKDKKLTARRTYRFGLMGLGACLLLAVLGGRVLANLGDEATPLLHTTLTRGPAAGLITTPEQADDYGEVLDELDRYRQETEEEEYLLLVEKLPLGYLYAEKRPSSPYVRSVALNSTSLSIYLWDHRERLPQHILQPRSGYGRGNENSEPDLQQARWLMDADVQLITTRCAYWYEAKQGDSLLTGSFTGAGAGG